MKNVLFMMISVFRRSPTMRRSISAYAGCRTRLPQKRLRVSIFAVSRNAVRSFRLNPASSRTVMTNPK